jgi:thiol-disulfide isomerase/thioredoxin
MSRRHPISLRLPTALLLGLLLSPAVASCAGEGKGDQVAAATGGPEEREDPYAKLSIQDAQGRLIRLSDFKGHVRIIDIWATWCGPCRMIIPHLNRLYDQYRGKGLVVIGVSVDDDPADVVEFTKRLPLKYPSGMINPEIVRLLGEPDAVPTSYLIDRKGRLRRKFVGFVDPETMEREVRKYLEAP